MSEQTATAVNLKQARMASVSEIMLRDPIYQAERIAKHYLAHATISKYLLDMIELYKRSQDTDLIPLIERAVQEIKSNHAYDFGIELKWRAPTFR
jgi:hypothetical protein